GRLRDRDEGRLVGDLEDRETDRIRLREERLRDLGVVKAGAEAEARHPGVGEPANEGPLFLRVLEWDPGRQQELTAREPRCGIEQLGDMDPANLPRGRLVSTRQ